MSKLFEHKPTEEESNERKRINTVLRELERELCRELYKFKGSKTKNTTFKGCGSDYVFEYIGNDLHPIYEPNYRICFGQHLDQEVQIIKQVMNKFGILSASSVTNLGNANYCLYFTVLSRVFKPVDKIALHNIKQSKFFLERNFNLLSWGIEVVQPYETNPQFVPYTFILNFPGSRLTFSHMELHNFLTRNGFEYQDLVFGGLNNKSGLLVSCYRRCQRLEGVPNG